MYGNSNVNSVLLKERHSTSNIMDESIISKLEDLIKMEDKKTVKQPISYEQDGDYSVILKKDVTYIVAVVVMQENKVLLMRESKSSCRGRWYLPAGRMHSNETIVDAAKRETLEETGLTIEPESLILVETFYGCRWSRFTFTAHVTGGTLKTTEDKESMEANWYFPHEIKNLVIRCTDFFYLLDLGVEWFNRKLAMGQENVFKILPVLQSHSCLKAKVVLVKYSTSNETRAGYDDHLLASPPGHLRDMKILLFDKPGHPRTLPCCVSKKGIDESIQEAIDGALESCGFLDKSFKVKGILALEHSGNSNEKADGFCCTFLAEVGDDFSSAQEGDNLSWLSVKDPSLCNHIKELLKHKMCVVSMSRK